MATQLSAITMIGTTGQGYVNGMRFLQFYYALPGGDGRAVAVTLVPFFHNAKIFTATRPWNAIPTPRTRAVTSLLFLASPAAVARRSSSRLASVVLVVVMGWHLTRLALLIALPGPRSTRLFGGVQAWTWTDVKQMVLSSAGLCRVVVLVAGLPDGTSARRGGDCAGATGPDADLFRLSFDPHQPVHVLGRGTIAALSLCSYFGTDQSQVQRLPHHEVGDEARVSLLMSAYWKIPLQALVLLVGSAALPLLHVHARRRCLFNTIHERRCAEGPARADVRRARSGASRGATARARRREGGPRRCRRRRATTAERAAAAASSTSPADYPR
jgi:Na+/proline symporter